MEYKQIIKDYERHQREFIKRCKTLLKAVSDVPEPTEKERRETYQRVINERKHWDRVLPQEELHLRCAINYALHKKEQEDVCD